jgi:transposase
MVHTMKDQVRGSTRSRRQHERGFKDDLIAQSLVAGASVSAIALKGGINANLLFKWRREHVRTMIEPVPAAGALLPVCVIPDVDSMPISHPPASGGAGGSRSARQGVIEIEIAGAQLRLRGGVDETMLASVLRALRQSA